MAPEIHAALIVGIPALIMLARQLAAVLPGKRALYANVALQLLIAVGLAVGMGAEALGVPELAGALVGGSVNAGAAWGLVEIIKRTSAKGDELVKGKTGTGAITPTK